MTATATTKPATKKAAAKPAAKKATPRIAVIPVAVPRKPDTREQAFYPLDVDALELVALSASPDTARPILCSVAVWVGEGDVIDTMAATDSYTLVWWGDNPPDRSPDVLIPVEDVKDVRKRAGKGGTVLLARHGVEWSLRVASSATVSGGVVNLRVIGEFPRVGQIVAGETPDNRKPIKSVAFGIGLITLAAIVKKNSWPAAQKGKQNTEQSHPYAWFITEARSLGDNGGALTPLTGRIGGRVPLSFLVMPVRVS